MSLPPNAQQRSWQCLKTVSRALIDLGKLLALVFRSPSALAAENLFLRKQLALFQERQVKPHRADDATRWILAILSRWFDWRGALSWSSRTLLSVGTETDFACSGVGNPDLWEGLRCQRTSGNSSAL